MSTKAKAKRARRPIYLMVQRLVDPATGEEVGALVPAHPIDKALLRERKFNVGREIRAELKQRRNVKFHRLIHSVGQLLVENCDGFESMTGHDAIKQVQREAGVMCESMEIDLGSLGKVPVKVPRSIAFDEMDEGEAHELFEGLRKHIEAKYLPEFDQHIRGDYWQMVEGGR